MVRKGGEAGHHHACRHPAQALLVDKSTRFGRIDAYNFPIRMYASRRFLSIVSVVGMFSVALAPLAAGAKSDASEKESPKGYIVVLKDDADADAVSLDMEKSHGLALGHVYKNALKGFSANIPEARLAKIRADDRVAFVSEDAEVRISARKPAPQPAQALPTGVNRVDAELNALNKGAGIGVAVIDTGIDLTHPDLSGNIVASKSCVTGSKNGNDDNGHGSHVAGTIAALNNTTGVVGVAPQAKLIAVKVLNAQGSGTWSSVICGIDWVTANAATYNIKVANMSLGGSGSNDGNCGNTNGDALHKAICRSRDAGVTYVVAAGNEGANTSLSVPASYDDAVITVSALADSDGTSGGLGSSSGYGADDTFASFSNYGTAVDIAAPGVNIKSTWKSGGYQTISGTSMATPHVAGAAALLLKANPSFTWMQVRDGLRAAGEILGAGHTDPSGLHAEPVVNASAL